MGSQPGPKQRNLIRKHFRAGALIRIKSSNIVHANCQEASVKTCTVLVCFLLAGSLLAQTKSSPPEVPAKSQSAQQSATSSGPSKIDPAKEADIRHLMDLIGTKQLLGQVMDAMEKSIKPLMTSALPAGEYREKLVNLFFEKFHSKADLQQLLDMAVPAYDKYYSREEIKGLIQFYETPLGHKMVSVLPKLTGDLQEAGKKWGEKVGGDCMGEVLSEHPELATALDAAKKGTSPPE